MKVLGSRELLADVLAKELCIGCGACVSLCPYFRSYNGKTAMLFPCTQEQGRCFAYCPKVEVDLDEVSGKIFGAPYSMEPLGRSLSVMMSRAGKKAAGDNCQSGGTVTALMTYALSNKLCDAAVLTGREGLNAVPAIVTDPGEVKNYASSKYTSAPTLEAFNRAVERGFTRIGVVATPCQVLALAQMRSNPLAKKDFTDPTSLVVGLFCTWSLDYRAFRRLLEGRVDIKDIKKFDIPPPPAEVMEIYTDRGTVEIPLAEVRSTVPNSCDYCFDMTSEFADVSVGVVEGRSGMNTIVVRTERGRAAVDAAVKAGFLELEDMPADNLARLRTAAGNKKKRALKKAAGEGIINTADGRRSLIRLEPKNLAGI
ncbi:MAG TPA: Coenzyme F420 hydrogenase/dehydrogenase, beta subunit C-terminal domain [Spirochaetota bacterium]|nr:Coenzyme F420 hydrogenase/dehydrogenase, beta subunit C-terminal domain [Spirochaetota bacterium]HPV41755.1 Coenzyme F420 hydrogenase/dehydrogenase, beta subunit C-terminal domain [Spirochaetota bacterium]